MIPFEILVFAQYQFRNLHNIFSMKSSEFLLFAQYLSNVGHFLAKEGTRHIADCKLYSHRMFYFLLVLDNT